MSPVYVAQLQKYDLQLYHTKGKELFVVGTLSHAYLYVPSTDNGEEDLELVVKLASV